MRFERSAWRQLAKLAPLLLGVAGLTLLFLGAGVAIAELSGVEFTALLSDAYSYTGSRLTSVVSNVGVMVWVATTVICLFSWWVIPARKHLRQWRRFFAWSGLVTLMLALDDYFAIHEFSHELYEAMTGDDSSRAVKNALEASVFLVYAAVVVVYLRTFKAQLLRTDYVVLGAAFVLFGVSLAMDMVPASWIRAVTGLPIEALLDDGAKAVGIAMYCTYFVRTAGQMVRRTTTKPR